MLSNRKRYLDVPLYWQVASLWEVIGYIGTVAKSVDSQCQTFQTAIAVLGRQWNALILNVLQEGSLWFSELSERAKGPGDKVLSARLKELERRGLVMSARAARAAAARGSGQAGRGRV